MSNGIDDLVPEFSGLCAKLKVHKVTNIIIVAMKVTDYLNTTWKRSALNISDQVKIMGECLSGTSTEASHLRYCIASPFLPNL